MAIRLMKFHRELRALGVPVNGVIAIGVTIGGVAPDVQIDFQPSATAQQIAAANAAKLAHDPTDTDTTNLADVQARWLSSTIHGKTPNQIYTLIQGQVDGWVTLAQAKSDLRIILPLLCAAVAWSVMQEQQR